MSNGKFPVLFFKKSGYCKELKCSYFQGRYEARTQEQYDALKPFACKELGGSAKVESLSDLTVPALRGIASDLGVENYAKKKKPALIKAIEEKRAELANPKPVEEDPEEEDSGDALADQEDIVLESGE